MGLFSLNNILLEENNSTNRNPIRIDIDDIGYINHDIQSHSFVQEGYDAILEMNAYFCNAEKDFYSRILGSYGDDKIINEGFSDFFNRIKDIIKKFIDWIKKVFKEFAAKLAALVNSDKYIKKNKNLLNKFDSEDEFEFQGYKYSEIDTTNLPKATAADAFKFGTENASVGNAVIDFSKYFEIGTKTDNEYYFKDDSPDWTTYGDFDSKNDGDHTKEVNRRKEATEKANKAINADIEALSNGNEDFYDEFRGHVIGKDVKLDSKEFSEELFKIFRSGEDSTESITIDFNFVHEAYRRFDKYKDVTKEIEKKKNEMIKDYEALEKELDRYIEYNKDTHKMTRHSNTSARTTDFGLTNIKLNASDRDDYIIYDKSTTDRLQSLLKVWSSRVSQMCQIHTQAFSAKLEAAKDCFNQDKKILNKAIQVIIKNHEGKD